ncbi:GntR family transcriptional regulator [Paraburkholderia sp. MMS20-SJTR3]|uniref:GntR family transcriptional regulator n=1 Tax=Paraburkholderia sejongensis TaxID=2886946 RepID=A0ABS8JRP3_9BURK|nr:GntR family transcriptional regulator [Paraburkholderia sp. MMS20-SJTR3]MCC8392575.1 GntR family transcriptional regulator [Paraburkholderia sp. MMS20-SJTR3]
MTPPSADLDPDAPAAPDTAEFGGPPRSRAESVYALLKADIAEFRLVPGDRFTENEVCERLGVSRTPVRQALFRMKQEGIVEVLFRSGWRVLPFDFRKFEELYDLRMVLETEAVTRICAGSPDADRASLDALAAIWLVAPEDRLQDMAQVGALDEAFHCTLVSAAGNAEMAHVHREVSERIRIIRRLDFTKPARVAATYDEHGKILQAILARRGDEACRILRAHIGASQLEVRKITLHEVYLARHQARQAQEAAGGQD